MKCAFHIWLKSLLVYLCLHAILMSDFLPSYLRKLSWFSRGLISKQTRQVSLAEQSRDQNTVTQRSHINLNSI